MAIEFLKPGGPLKFRLDDTVFLLRRLSSAEQEAIKRQCWEEGKMGVRQGLNEDLFADKLLEASLIGWENFIDVETKQPIEYSEDAKRQFVDYADHSLKSPMANMIVNPTTVHKLMDVVAEKKG